MNSTTTSVGRQFFSSSNFMCAPVFGFAGLRVYTKGRKEVYEFTLSDCGAAVKSCVFDRSFLRSSKLLQGADSRESRRPVRFWQEQAASLNLSV